MLYEYLVQPFIEFGFMRRALVASLALAVGGLVLTSFRGTTTYYYWMALAPAYGLISIVSGWRHADTGAARLQLIVTQSLHWLAFVGAMWLMFLPQVRGVDSDNATSLTLLILLALGTFVAGVHAQVWRICVVGIFLAAAVPAVAWIQESAMLLLVSALLLAAAAAVLWWLWRRERP